MTRITLATANRKGPCFEGLPPHGTSQEFGADAPGIYVYDPYGEAIWIVWEYDATTQVAFGHIDDGVNPPRVGAFHLTDLFRDMNTPVVSLAIDPTIQTRSDAFELYARRRNLRLSQ